MQSCLVFRPPSESIDGLRLRRGLEDFSGTPDRSFRCSSLNDQLCEARCKNISVDFNSMTVSEGEFKQEVPVFLALTFFEK